MNVIDASGYANETERVVAPVDERELAELLRSGTPLTVAGSKTGVTGGCVPETGWSVSMEKFRRLDIHPGYAVCGAGVLLRDLQSAAAQSGQFYAPDPTENSASIGGTLATNASGSRSYRYGPTRRHVRAIRVLTAGGDTLVLRRGEKPPFEIPAIPVPATTKNTAGYYRRSDADYLDLFIGSEGTLGIITEAELALLPARASVTAGVLFFDTESAALDAVDRFRAVDGIRMIEYFDAASLELLRTPFGAALLVEREGDDVDWLTGVYREESWVAVTAADRERFRQFRHALPEAVNDLMRRRGLMKMGSDYAVPIDRNREMLANYRRALDREFPGRYVIFGHIGDAHLHVNVLPADDVEWGRAQELMIQFARQAVALGGTVSAEHGLGKRKRGLLHIQYSDADIEKMKSIKRRLDPQCILGRGNLFDRVELE